MADFGERINFSNFKQKEREGAIFTWLFHVVSSEFGGK